MSGELSRFCRLWLGRLEALGGANGGHGLIDPLQGASGLSSLRVVPPYPKASSTVFVDHFTRLMRACRSSQQRELPPAKREEGKECSMRKSLGRWHGYQ